MIASKWAVRFKTAIPEARCQRAHADAFRLLAGVHRRRRVRIEFRTVLESMQKELADCLLYTSPSPRD
eukprot:1200332-Alexandrium_andersonii.AAC.1